MEHPFFITFCAVTIFVALAVSLLHNQHKTYIIVLALWFLAMLWLTIVVPAGILARELFF